MPDAGGARSFERRAHRRRRREVRAFAARWPLGASREVGPQCSGRQSASAARCDARVFQRSGNFLMKYIIIHGDGMADWACDELGGKTPLQAAHKPNMDLLATRGTLGMVATIPKGRPAGSDVGTMTMLGYDPARYHTGRAPIEAASQGIELAPDDVVFRMNLVSLKAGADGEAIMDDFTSGHITTEEAAKIVADLRSQLAGDGIEFHNGVSYRHLMVWHGGPNATHLTPPHDIPGKPAGPHMPHGDGAERLRTIMDRAAAILREHPV